MVYSIECLASLSKRAGLLLQPFEDLGIFTAFVQCLQSSGTLEMSTMKICGIFTAFCFVSAEFWDTGDEHHEDPPLPLLVHLPPVSPQVGFVLDWSARKTCPEPNVRLFAPVS